MKLNYTFEFMEIDDEVVAVPVGDNAGKLHGIVKLNASGAEILKMIQDGKTEREIVDALNKKYQSADSELGKYVSKYLIHLNEIGLL